jgi:N-dimethylarginine dimethylaminohydrolase
MPEVLMCPPQHYSIQYEINPWMKMKNGINPARARKQWDALVKTLTDLGVRVRTIPQKKGCPDMVFTANAGVVDQRTFIPSRFRFRERRGEEPAFIAYFRRRGFRIRDVAQGHFFEGEGDLLGYRDLLFGGFRYRSEIAAHEAVAATLKRRLITLELMQPHFYHLDTCFFPLDDKTAIFYPGAFDAYGRKVIGQFIENPVPVSKADAERFACNAFRVEKTVVLNKASPTLKKALARLGYSVRESPTSEFMKAGGSVKCLLLKL